MSSSSCSRIAKRARRYFYFRTFRRFRSGTEQAFCYARLDYERNHVDVRAGNNGTNGTRALPLTALKIGSTRLLSNAVIVYCFSPDDPDGNDAANDAEDTAGRSSMNTTMSEEVIGEIRRCAGCHRFEPLFASPDKHFIDVGDSDTGRCVCLACCRTVVTTSDDVVPLWEKVIDFFEGPLGLITSEESLFPGLEPGVPYAGPCGKLRTKTGVTRQDLKNIPIVVVGMEALNDNMRQQGGSGSGHYKSSQIMTRGLCLSESCGGDHGIAGVTAILCLSGLPADLTASILAHEATHAWIKLHPNFPYMDPLPLRVEEGLCQLVAHLFLNDGLEPVEQREEAARRNGAEAVDSNPSDEKLRQYFRFCIETDEGVYGEGFRLAARAYARMGMQELLYHVAVNHDFPPL